MHYIKKIYVLLLTGSIVSITGCSAIQYSTEDLPKSTFQKSTEDTAKDIVKSVGIGFLADNILDGASATFSRIRARMLKRHQQKFNDKKYTNH